jgi:hypothetical protein
MCEREYWCLHMFQTVFQSHQILPLLEAASRARGQKCLQFNWEIQTELYLSPPPREQATHPDTPMEPAQGSCQYLLAHVVFMLPPATGVAKPVAHIPPTASQDVLIVFLLTTSPSLCHPSMYTTGTKYEYPVWCWLMLEVCLPPFFLLPKENNLNTTHSVI